MTRRSLVAALTFTAYLATACRTEDSLEDDITSTPQPLSDPLSETPQNGFDPAGIAPNHPLLLNVWRHPLDTAGFAVTLGTSVSPGSSTPISSLFTAASAGQLMDEIVSCALDSSHEVTAWIPETGTMNTWRGKFGLCDTGSPFGDWRTYDWRTSALGNDQECRQIVSACVIARMNARGRHVPLSIRVADEFRTNAIDVSRFGLVDRVRVQMNDRFGTPRASGWQPDFVGICARGTTVTLQRVTNPGHTVRVCTGVNACDPGVWDPIAKGSPRLYSGFLVDTPPGESISFRCPEGAAPYGNPERSYFSILVDLGPGASPLVDPVLVRTPSPTTIYPAPERDVFTYLEGAFYGQLLPSSDDWFDMNTCSSPLWADGPAYEQGRICSFSGMVAGCHGIHRGPCAVACPRGGLGAVDAYHDCQSDADVLPWLTVTVFLNEPSAIVSDPAASATVPLHGVCTTGTRLDSGRGSVVTNVCAADSFCCNTAWDSTCVGEVESVAGSLECVCSHDVCTTGTALSSMCGPVAKSVCDADGYCCNTAWDSTCVAEVESVASSQECVVPP